MKLPQRTGQRPELQRMTYAIQEAMRRKGLDVAELTEALGLHKSQRGAVSNWVGGVNGVGSRLRPRVAQVLELREDQLKFPRRPDPAEQTAMTLLPQATEQSNGELLAAPSPTTDVFSVRVRSDGSLSVRLETTLPFAKGAQLVQFLLSFGLAPGAEETAP